MKAYKWRIILSVVCTLLSIGMSPAFFGGVPASSLYYAVNWLNLIPTVALNFVLTHVPILMRGRNSLPYLSWVCRLTVFLFWWWVGWKIDGKTSGRKSGRGWTIAEFVGALVLALLMLVESRGPQVQIHPYWAMIVWDAILLCNALSLVSRLRAVEPWGCPTIVPVLLTTTGWGF